MINANIFLIEAIFIIALQSHFIEVGIRANKGADVPQRDYSRRLKSRFKYPIKIQFSQVSPS